MKNRTGKRTRMGAVKDGINSVIRYFNNNFNDGYFEDCLNLTFNRVKMNEQTDKLTLKMKRYTIVGMMNDDEIQGSFFCIVLVPTTALCYLVSKLVSKGGDMIIGMMIRLCF